MFNAKLVKTVLLAVVIVGGIWVLTHRERIHDPNDVLQVARESIDGWIDFGAPPNSDESVPARLPTTEKTAKGNAQRISHQPMVQGVIRIVSWRLNPGITQLASEEPVQLVANLCRQYDVIILQDLDRNETTWIKQLTDHMNRLGGAGSAHLAALPNGNRADYIAISDRQQQSDRSQTVMVFNRRTVQLDEARWYLVQDPDEVFSRDPMVAWFRALGVPPEQAFTFSLASVSISQERPDLELVHLGALIRAIRNDGRLEDDVILAGDFQSDDRGLEALRSQAGISWIVSNRPTSIVGDLQLDNIVFNESATVEFTGRGGVVDLAQQYQLRIEDAAAVANSRPVWAEFSAAENGSFRSEVPIPGRVAAKPEL